MFISLAPLYGVTCVIQTCEASRKLCRSIFAVGIPLPYLSFLKKSKIQKAGLVEYVGLDSANDEFKVTIFLPFIFACNFGMPENAS